MRSAQLSSGPEKDGFTFDRVFPPGTKQHEVFDYGVKEYVALLALIFGADIMRVRGQYCEGYATGPRSPYVQLLIQSSDVLDGYNGTVFAYGQTGSGKTFTMMASVVLTLTTRLLNYV